MGNMLVIYDSHTGFTEKMAEIMVQGARSTKAADVGMFKLGTPFSIGKLKEADAIILGSPVVYGRVTSTMQSFLTSLQEHQASQRLNLRGKVGSAFGSYAFSGGWVIQELSEQMQNLGIRVVAPPISAVDGIGRSRPIRLNETIRQKCHELGRVTAEKVFSGHRDIQ